ncbi:MAG: AAA family ATPase [Leeuwenhoekiella sp.]
MEELYDFQQNLLLQPLPPKRAITDEINFANRLLGIKGARGVGKTTLLLQKIKDFEALGKRVLYATLDHLFFLENTLIDLAKEFTLIGGEHLLLDEVHKYPRWSRELKLLYDMFPKLHIVFTSSSMLEIYRGESDLSRRALTYNLQELSFREYLEIHLKAQLPKFELDDLISDHGDVAQQLRQMVPQPILHFREYLKFGAYPYYFEDRKIYYDKVARTIDLIIEMDMNAVENIPYSESRNIKKLLVAIAQSAPFTPNVAKLSERLGLKRKFLLNALQLLGRADLIVEMFKTGKGIGAFTKPQKIYLHNPNLIYVLGGKNTSIGAVRETFFANQMKLHHQINLPEKGDFLIDEIYTFEVGGNSKTAKQLAGVTDAYVVRDNLEVGGMNIIPLWLFGFLY